MTTIEQKIRSALDETRILILGIQVLIGLQWRAAFEKGYETLAPGLQYLGLIGLVLMLVGFSVLVAPVCYHNIVAKGEDTPQMHSFATRCAEIALLPFAAALGLNMFMTADRIESRGIALLLGVAMTVVALGFWYGWEIMCLGAERKRKEPMEQNEPTKLSSKIDHALTEARMVLPGAQALLGFQFVAVFAESFEKLPKTLKEIHLLSLLLVALCAVLLMSPAAYHRIVERGENTARFYTVANRLVLAALVPLGIGISLDFYVVAQKIIQHNGAAVISALALATIYFGLWFGVTGWMRSKEAGHEE
ncbi:MAG: DUF6328 family protein [Verrucomicrobiota bacterium]